MDRHAHEPNPLAGVAAGAIGGLLGSWLMVVVQHAMGGNGRGSHPGDTHPQRRRDGATVEGVRRVLRAGG